MSAIIVLVLRILLAISLYVFLFLAIFRMWERFEQPKIGEVAEKPEISIILDDQEVPVSFKQNEISIGRSDDNDLAIDDEAVSSRHARIIFENGKWMLEDLNSTNGTYLNNQRIFTSTVLINGDEIMLGKQSLLIDIPDAYPL